MNFLVLICSDERLRAWIPSFRRALYTVGLLLRYFDFTLPEIYIDLEVSRGLVPAIAGPNLVGPRVFAHPDRSFGTKDKKQIILCMKISKLQREHPALQNMTFLRFFLFFFEDLFGFQIRTPILYFLT